MFLCNGGIKKEGGKVLSVNEGEMVGYFVFCKLLALAWCIIVLGRRRRCVRLTLRI